MTDDYVMEQLRSQITNLTSQIRKKQSQIAEIDKTIERLEIASEELDDVSVRVKKRIKQEREVFSSEGRWKGETYNEYARKGERINEMLNEQYSTKLKGLRDAVENEIAAQKKKRNSLTGGIGWIGCEISDLKRKLASYFD